MSSNLLLNSILSIQYEYQELLRILLPKLKSARFPEALDEINLFWTRHIDVVQLYLKSMFTGEESYVFTATTYLDFEANEHLPFLLLGQKHVFDDPLCKYSEICTKIPDGRDSNFLYEQVGTTAEDNLKILENISGAIIILPLRLLSQSNAYNILFEYGEQAFISMFNNIQNFEDYFSKCSSIEDIILHLRKDIDKTIIFSEDDDFSLPLRKRYEIAVSQAEYMVDNTKNDSYNFFMLVFGYIQQAIDILASCLEYGCIPYVRYPVSLHYISLLSENLLDIEPVEMIRYKMHIAFWVHQLCDNKRLAKISMDEFLHKVQEYNFNQKLFDSLEKQGINKKTILDHSIRPVILAELEKFYLLLDTVESTTPTCIQSIH